MCNLNSLTKGQSAIRALFRASHDRTGKSAPVPGHLPRPLAPIMRNSADGERELVMARCANSTDKADGRHRTLRGG
jgi:hypothetical protein